MTPGTIYTLRLDQDALDDYLTLYFKEYPRRRKKPIDKPFVPSLNKYLVMNKDARNELKQHWQDFVYVAAKRQGLLGLKIDYCKVTLTYVFGDLRKSDVDNRGWSAAFIRKNDRITTWIQEKP